MIETFFKEDKGRYMMSVKKNKRFNLFLQRVNGFGHAKRLFLIWQQYFSERETHGFRALATSSKRGYDDPLRFAVHVQRNGADSTTHLSA